MRKREEKGKRRKREKREVRRSNMGDNSRRVTLTREGIVLEKLSRLCQREREM